MRWRPHFLPLAGLTAFAIPLFFFELGHYGLVNGDEAFYHGVARHMVETGNWFRIEFAGQQRFYDTFSHSPLLVWLKALVLTVAGDSYGSMRCVSAAFALLSLFATYALACRVANRRVALLAGLLQLTTFEFVFIHSARTGEMEPLITCALTLAPLLFLRAVEDDRSFVPHHLCLVALLNLKLALIVIPLAAEFLYLALTPSHRRHFVRWLAHAAWMLPLGSSWHFYQMTLHWGPFLDTLSTMQDQASGPRFRPFGNLLYYTNTLFWGGFPHSLFYPAGIVGAIVLQRSTEAHLRWRVMGLYALVLFAFFVFVFIHHIWYVIPLYPFLSIATASWLLSLATGPQRWWAVAAAAGAVAVGLWARLPIFSMNPFAVQATHVRAAVGWVGLGGFGAGFCIGSSLLLAVGAAAVLGRRMTAGAIRYLAIALCLGTLAVGGIRVVAPLRFTDYVSPLDGLARELAARRARGEAIEFPVQMPDWHWDRLMVRYLFADDYRIGTQRKTLLGRSINVPVLLAEREGTRKSLQPNVLLITVDTLRADHLEAWGYPRATSPAISRLAREGVRFANAVAQAPWTLPSMATLHTSLYPTEHGATHAMSKLNPLHTTLAEVLRGAGYHTLAVVSHVFVGRRRGFAKGFDVFDESQIKRHDATTSPGITDTALDMIGSRGAAEAAKPFFLWVHYFDPHYSYMRHPEFDFAGTKGTPPPVPLVINYLRIVAKKVDSEGRSRLRPEHVEYIEEVYDEEIAFTDVALARLLEGVRGRDTRRPTVVVLAADHGEFFMERGSLGHEDPAIYQAVVHVPLIISGDIDEELRGRVVEAPVEVGSVGRTIAGLAGIRPNPFRGGDLLEIAGKRDAEGAAYMEALSGWRRHDRIVGVAAGEWKLIHNRTRDTHELYHLPSDPTERRNRWNDGAPETAAAGEHLKKLLGDFQPRRAVPTKLPGLSDAERGHLRSLGYLE